MNPRYSRPLVLALACFCAVLSVGFYVISPLLSIYSISLAIFPIGLATLWYTLGDSREVKGYGATALITSFASLFLPLSLSVGPLFPAVIGLSTLSFFKKDLFLLSAALVSVISIFLADGELPLRVAITGISEGLPGATVYTVLAVLMGLLAIASAITDKSSSKYPYNTHD